MFFYVEVILEITKYQPSSTLYYVYKKMDLTFIFTTMHCVT